MTPLTIAVDGPSGSGKSSVSKEVARRLGLGYLDTGAMYRVACWSVLANQINVDDADAVAAHIADLKFDMPTDPDEQTIRVEGDEVTAAIRGAEVTGAVSRVAANLAVRATLRERQRAIISAEGRGSRRGIVAEGRDITTVVAPEADVRVLLTASEEARLARRAREVHGSDDAAAVAATRGQILDRDDADSTVSSFHTAADGVVHLDSSALDFEQTVQALLDIVALTAGISVLRLDEVSQARS